MHRIWADPDTILLVFAGSAAEFALNRAVDWLFFTNALPRDPVGRLFSTVTFAQRLLFAAEHDGQQTLDRIRAIHAGVEQRRGRSIPGWAHRDVLYMLMAYSESSYRLLHGSLDAARQEELYAAFLRIGHGLRIPDLPASYAHWTRDRQLHLERDLEFSAYTARLFAEYRRHLGPWRYRLLLEVQSLLVPERVRSLLGLAPNRVLASALWTYPLAERLRLLPAIRRALIPPRYWTDIQKLETSAAA